MASGAEAGARPGRWKAGLTVSILAMVLLLGIGLATESFGFAFVLGAPFVCGYIIGRWVRINRVLRVLCALFVLTGVVVGAVSTSLAGEVCGATFFAIASIPLIAGVFVGAYLNGRSWVPTSAASVVLIALLIPLEQAAIPEARVESVSTTRLVEMRPTDVFSRITFYEDTTERPPTLLRIALPRPVRTLGEADTVGDRPRCIYDAGYIVKEVTRVEAPEHYAFRVIEQVGVEDHAVALVAGSFEISAPDGKHSRVVLTTTYRPKLSARIAWRPFERAVIKALHEHVLDAMFMEDGGNHAA